MAFFYNVTRQKCRNRNNIISEKFGIKVEDDTKYGKSITRGYTPHVNWTFVTQGHKKVISLQERRDRKVDKNWSLGIVYRDNIEATINVTLCNTRK